MWIVGLTLGFFGSLHCVGMCGPLALAFCHKEGQSKANHLLSSLQYSIGKTLTYALMGIIFGGLGSLLFFTNVQKGLSIVLGIVLILSFVLQFDIDNKINTIPLIQKYYDKVQSLLRGLYHNSRNRSTFILGMANGLLPCGLVYVALAGAISTSSLIEGTIFMGAFGLGTTPIMIALIVGYDMSSVHVRSRLRSLMPYISFVFGIFLIYRGIMVDLPLNLNFWQAIKNPIMCH